MQRFCFSKSMINFTVKTPIYISGGGFMGDDILARIFKLCYMKKNKNIYISNENLRFLLLETISKYSLNFILTFYNIR